MKKLYLLLLVLATVLVACKKDGDVEFTTFEIVDEKFTSLYTSVDLSCKVRCTATINELYLQYDTVVDFSTYREVELVENKKTDVYSVKIDDLLVNTTYYVRYVAVNSYSQVTSEQVSEFKTLQAATPTIEVRDIIDVLDTIATVGFVLKFDGGADVTKMGVCWSVDSVPTIEGENVECSSEVINSVSDGDSLVLKISGLKANTTYYVRAYAENKLGIGYSMSKSFLTLSLPEVITSEVTDIKSGSVVLNGEAVFNGNDATTEYGFCWGEESMPTFEGDFVRVDKANFSSKLSNLKAETKYYVRAYAKNKIGIVYGAEKEFVTKMAEAPVVETIEVTDITDTSAKVGGNVVSTGGVEITERGVCYSTTENPTIENSKKVVDGGFGSFTVVLSGLQLVTKYYVRAYAQNKKGVSYGEQINFETKYSEENGYRYVDLGLSVKWATCNVGATTPEDYGDYFAWGETTPKKNYYWTTYKYCKGMDETMTKYCHNSNYGYNGFTDNKLVLDPKDDVAHVNWGGSWRMPTKAEMTELQEKCRWRWTTQNGVDGCKVVGPNGNSIFLPAAGYMEGGTLNDVGSNGLYWSSSLYTDYPNSAYHVYLSFAGSNLFGWMRYRGLSVRPVCK